MRAEHLGQLHERFPRRHVAVDDELLQAVLQHRSGLALQQTWRERALQ